MSTVHEAYATGWLDDFEPAELPRSARTPAA
jgi:hypothetical protein